jgi:hypothetical protein
LCRLLVATGAGVSVIHLATGKWAWLLLLAVALMVAGFAVGCIGCLKLAADLRDRNAISDEVLEDKGILTKQEVRHGIIRLQARMAKAVDARMTWEGTGDVCY